ncbi:MULTISPECIES: phage major capsid protein [Acinetobacter]|uniref:phage major capsid protein n=1 Tax=Acinetobacter TaxID=469 RepID=UPI00070A2147|nr:MULTISPECIES: phage major capsid protein [Acinetobacter]KRJ70821.1 capsid protein [Acinetobacter pittii]MDA3462731.1 phage major capsid protein [Acinetobacter sp. AOR41_HL]
MPIEKKDIEEVAADLKGTFEDFKKKNDKELEGIKAEKGKLSEEVEKINEKLGDLDKLKTELEKELKEAKRPGATDGKEVGEHKSAFYQFLRKGIDDGLSELEIKAVQTTTNQDGGYAVPEELDRTLLELLKDESPMRAVCSQMTIGTPDYKKLVNLGGAGSGWVGETDNRPATGTPTLAQIQAYMGEIYANPQATQTSLDDVFFDVENWISTEVAQEFAEKEGQAFLLGDGDKKPKGILAYAMATTNDKTRAFGTLQQIKSGQAGNFTGDNLIDLIYSLKKGYRNGALFMMTNLTQSKVRKFKDSEGNYIWQPGLQLGQPSTLLGYGIEENEDMPESEADANAVLFGNFKRGYLITDRMGTRVLRDPYTNKPYVGFYTTKRTGGMLTDSNAIKVLTLAA